MWPRVVGRMTSVLWIRANSSIHERRDASAQAGALRPCFQRLAQDIAEEADQDVRLHSLCRQVPHWPKSQLILLDPERGLSVQCCHYCGS